jgi:hypothetical protein
VLQSCGRAALKLLELIKSSSSCAYTRFPYTRDYYVELECEFEDAGAVVKVELDSEKHSEIVKYVREVCEE